MTDAIKDLESQVTEDSELLQLIRDDLRMRSNENGLVNISGFIWDMIMERVPDES